MPSADELRAALAVAELEEQLVAAKDGDTDSPEYRALKDELREARRSHREQREAVAAEVAEGDAVVRPEAVVASVELNQ